MSQLSKQSIFKLCTRTPTMTNYEVMHGRDKPWHPLISPFEPSKVKVEGVSKGLSSASYDASIAHDLTLGRHPSFVIRQWVFDHFNGLRDVDRDTVSLSLLQRIAKVLKAVQALYMLLADLGDLYRRLRDEPPHFALAYTVEDFCLPANVGGAVCDKSTFARRFVSAYNTFFDPGFHGNATLELVNDSDKVVTYKAGQGVCQFVFTWLDEPTEEPYNGKYQHQTKEAHGPRFETDAPISDVPKLPDHWRLKSYPWKGGFEYVLERKDFMRGDGQVRLESDILPDAVASAKRIDQRQPMKDQ